MNIDNRNQSKQVEQKKAQLQKILEIINIDGSSGFDILSGDFFNYEGKIIGIPNYINFLDELLKCKIERLKIPEELDNEQKKILLEMSKLKNTIDNISSNSIKTDKKIELARMKSYLELLNKKAQNIKVAKTSPATSNPKQQIDPGFVDQASNNIDSNGHISNTKVSTSDLVDSNPTEILQESDKKDPATTLDADQNQKDVQSPTETPLPQSQIPTKNLFLESFKSQISIVPGLIPLNPIELAITKVRESINNSTNTDQKQPNPEPAQPEEKKFEEKEEAKEEKNENPKENKETAPEEKKETDEEKKEKAEREEIIKFIQDIKKPATQAKESRTRLGKFIDWIKSPQVQECARASAKFVGGGVLAIAASTTLLPLSALSGAAAMWALPIAYAVGLRFSIDGALHGAQKLGTYLWYRRGINKCHKIISSKENSIQGLESYLLQYQDTINELSKKDYQIIKDTKAEIDLYHSVIEKNKTQLSDLSNKLDRAEKFCNVVRPWVSTLATFGSSLTLGLPTGYHDFGGAVANSGPDGVYHLTFWNAWGSKFILNPGDATEGLSLYSRFIGQAHDLGSFSGNIASIHLHGGIVLSQFLMFGTQYLQTRKRGYGFKEVLPKFWGNSIGEHKSSLLVWIGKKWKELTEGKKEKKKENNDLSTEPSTPTDKPKEPDKKVTAGDIGDSMLQKVAVYFHLLHGKNTDDIKVLKQGIIKRICDKYQEALQSFIDNDTPVNLDDFRTDIPKLYQIIGLQNNKQLLDGLNLDTHQAKVIKSFFDQTFESKITKIKTGNDELDKFIKKGYAIKLLDSLSNENKFNDHEKNIPDLADIIKTQAERKLKNYVNNPSTSTDMQSEINDLKNHLESIDLSKKVDEVLSSSANQLIHNIISNQNMLADAPKCIDVAELQPVANVCEAMKLLGKNDDEIKNFLLGQDRLNNLSLAKIIINKSRSISGNIVKLYGTCKSANNFTEFDKYIVNNSANNQIAIKEVENINSELGKIFAKYGQASLIDDNNQEKTFKAIQQNYFGICPDQKIDQNEYRAWIKKNKADSDCFKAFCNHDLISWELTGLDKLDYFALIKLCAKNLKNPPIDIRKEIILANQFIINHLIGIDNEKKLKNFLANELIKYIRINQFNPNHQNEDDKKINDDRKYLVIEFQKEIINSSASDNYKKIIIDCCNELLDSKNDQNDYRSKLNKGKDVFKKKKMQLRTITSNPPTTA